ncbi:hypothetical protein KIN20_020540 [Parelaphostrongylus tenuis]|uniref:Uncharacterized protein n=1 Tax=Parelaphostrongylus tenuis TaxID=148309 RepID=A0AAD5MT00_PARTN|nr:hypothetical protein KIN20_020540 [Parelaphostrongylus tenuis]
MMKRATNSSIISVVATISTVFGCGVTPAGQVSTTNFTVTGFTLPVAMVYSEAIDVRAQVPGIAANAAGATGFVRRLVMQTVIDVLESQARSALLPDAIISSILSQLEVNVAYVPMNCQKVVFNLMDNQEEMINKCIIVDNTVTGICPRKDKHQKMMCNQVMLGAVSETHLRISGTLSTRTSSWQIGRGQCGKV